MENRLTRWLTSGQEPDLASRSSHGPRRYHELEVDQDDNIHLLYAVFTDTLPGPNGIPAFPGPAPALISPKGPSPWLGWEGGYNDIIRPSLAVDANKNVFASYFTFSPLPTNLYIEKLDPDGNTVIDDLLIFPEYDNGAHGGAQTDIALDAER